MNQALEKQINKISLRKKSFLAYYYNKFLLPYNSIITLGTTFILNLHVYFVQYNIIKIKYNNSLEVSVKSMHLM